MFRPIKVVDIELNQPLMTIDNLEGYDTIQALVRLHGVPLGYVTLPVRDGRCRASALGKEILDRHSPAIICHLAGDGLAQPPQPDGLRIADLVHIPHVSCNRTLPSVTVAVCTRDRPADLARCLESLFRIEYPTIDFLVIDNAPATDATQRLVRERYPGARYFCEPRPGLDWARNKAISEAHGEILAYTDDDVVVDSGWIAALASVFAEHEDVMAVTGLVVPLELETEAQALFERYGGFGRGFEQRWARVDRARGQPFTYHGTGQFGTGANMSFRRSIFERIGGFDPALDVGTVTNGGGDLEMFFRVLKEGHTLVYEPSAIVRHCHRRDHAQLRAQIANNGVALDAYFIRSALAYPDERMAFVRFSIWWFGWRYLQGLVGSSSLPVKALLLREMWGYLTSPDRYHRARRTAVEIAGAESPCLQARTSPASVQPVRHHTQKASAVRIVDLSEPLRALNDVTDYPSVLVFVLWRGRPLGRVDIENCYTSIPPSRIREAVARRLSLQMIEPRRRINLKSLSAKVDFALARQYIPPEYDDTARSRLTCAGPGEFLRGADAFLSADISVSVIVATRDRPADLRNCLRSLMAQASRRRIEIVVVDNNPAAGLTAPVLAEFPRAVIVNEPRQGLAYARNAGICASTGEILVTTDDDVIAPPDWIEKLVAPFERADVMIVTGNVLPLELETRAQRLFEDYGGLGRGFDRREFGAAWFSRPTYSGVPTWTLGCTANAAFRSSIFAHPEVGLMDEALGPGMPSGVGEDTYLFYKALKAGLTTVYEPAAYVWHRHRREISGLRRQLYAYSKGHVAYHLTTLFSDNDIRGLLHLTLRLPRVHFSRIRARIRGWSNYPLSFLMLEIAGNLVGPLALWQSRRRVRREGRSAPYIPALQRSNNHEYTARTK